MSRFHSTAIIIGPSLQYVDHLVPICLELNIPLIMSEKMLYKLVEKYYPPITLKHSNFVYLYTYYFPQIKNLFSCLYGPTFKQVFGKMTSFKHFWLPHGYSDKALYSHTIYGPLDKETDLLLYSNKMIDEVRKSKVTSTTRCHILKNYRYYHFLKNKAFYLQKIAPYIPQTSKKIILYAPTWNDYNSLGSFNNFSKFLKVLTKDYFVVCKWHPNLLKQRPEKIDELEKMLENHDISFIHNCPLIYPLLSKVDLYLGDASSIGYDFLTFERPMVFLSEHDDNLPLYECGITLSKKEYPTIDQAVKKAFLTHKDLYLSKQQKLYQEVFGEKESIESFDNYFQNLKKELICHTLQP